MRSSQIGQGAPWKGHMNSLLKNLLVDVRPILGVTVPCWSGLFCQHFWGNCRFYLQDRSLSWVGKDTSYVWSKGKGGVCECTISPLALHCYTEGGSSRLFESVHFPGQNKPKTGSVSLFKSNAWNRENQYWFLHFHAADCLDCCLLGFPSSETRRRIPVLQRNMLSPSSGFPLPWTLLTTFLISAYSL